MSMIIYTAVRLTLFVPGSCPLPVACQPRPEQTVWCWWLTTCRAQSAVWCDLCEQPGTHLQNSMTLTWAGKASRTTLLPGEPTAIWHFFRWSLSWLTGLPPMKTWHSRPSMAQPIAMTTEWICTAISRVGARTRTFRTRKQIWPFLRILDRLWVIAD